MSQSQILIIEDDPAVAQSLEAGWVREGLNVVLRSNIIEGINYFRKNTPHLVVLDIRLPDGLEFDVCRSPSIASTVGEIQWHIRAAAWDSQLSMRS